MKKKQLISNIPLFIFFLFLIPVCLYVAVSIFGCRQSSVTATKQSYNKTISSYNWSPEQRQELKKDLAGIFDNRIFGTIVIATECNTHLDNDKDTFLGDGYIRVKEWLPGESFRYIFFSNIEEIPEIEKEAVTIAKNEPQFQ